MTAPTIAECIAWLERLGNDNPAHHPRATLAHLRQAERDAAKLADERVVRVRYGWLRDYFTATRIELARQRVAAWDAEREKEG